VNNPVPEKIRQYNVYVGPTASQKLAGVAAEITMPDFLFTSEEISGAGLLGSYESPNAGHTESTAITIPFRTPLREALSLAEGDFANITLRAGMQSTDIANGQIGEEGLVVNVRGPVKQINFGTMVKGQPMNVEVTIEILYFKASRDTGGSLFTLLELDKLNFVYVVNGVDKLANLRRYI
jgi:P2 family phage contractile tail tube protein